MDQSATFYEICTFFGDFLVKVGRTHLLFRGGDATQSTNNDPGPDIVLTRNRTIENSTLGHDLHALPVFVFWNHSENYPTLKGVQWNSVTKTLKKKWKWRTAKEIMFILLFSFTQGADVLVCCDAVLHTHTYTHQTLHPPSLRFRQTAWKVKHLSSWIKTHVCHRSFFNT